MDSDCVSDGGRDCLEAWKCWVIVGTRLHNQWAMLGNGWFMAGKWLDTWWVLDGCWMVAGEWLATCWIRGCILLRATWLLQGNGWLMADGWNMDA
eukprot:747109-Lingulodinium_polyedra.AAC.1